MQLFNNVNAMHEWCREQKKQGKTIGLVPTMGYLHDGHMSLVKAARQDCDIVVVSIFVNPIQFGQGEDYETYPRELEKDSALLANEKTDAIFAPGVKEMYPAGYDAYVEVQGAITGKMCGASRPGHFKGVTTVVSKLFHICQPDRAYFGQKDAQQLLIIKKMVRDLNFPLEIVRMPIVRESDGLAMSSRNVYLNAEERQQALVLNQALKTAANNIRGGERDIKKIHQQIKDMIETQPLAQIDYIEISSGENLTDLEEMRGEILLALAVKFGKTRLIDNLLVEV
ncbi:MAG: pantoate--beta-alanine ligase [Syntrophomonadaceae bacterium]|nr:pantoate--beta-alanine ligase [Syntrophomonadaceae bacterium]MDD3023064.1 pantoate--beta-alanine ligase [Syntrophomonadaceae bacterium]